MNLLLQPDAQQIADLLLSLLLVLMLAYAWRLDRGLGRLRGDRAAFERMLEEFTDGAKRAEEALRRFQTTSDGIGREIAAQVEIASSVRGELGTLAARAEILVGELKSETESAPRRFRTAAPSPAERPGRSERLIPPDDQLLDDLPRSHAERDLLRALKGLR